MRRAAVPVPFAAHSAKIPSSYYPLIPACLYRSTKPRARAIARVSPGGGHHHPITIPQTTAQAKLSFFRCSTPECLFSLVLQPSERRAQNAPATRPRRENGLVLPESNPRDTRRSLLSLPTLVIGQRRARRRITGKDSTAVGPRERGASTAVGQTPRRSRWTNAEIRPRSLRLQPPRFTTNDGYNCSCLFFFIE